MELFYSLKKGKSSVIPFMEGSGHFMPAGGDIQGGQEAECFAGNETQVREDGRCYFLFLLNSIFSNKYAMSTGTKQPPIITSQVSRLIFILAPQAGIMLDSL